MHSKLPPELECYIFEIFSAAEPQSTLILLRVARRVKYWLEPLLYRTILRSPETTSKFTDRVLSDLLVSKPQHCRDAVRNVMFYHMSDAATLGIVQRCRGMRNAWIHGPIGAKGVFAGLAALPRLERLHCDASFLGHLADAPPHAFARLSHLELFDSAPALKHVENLATALPALTHLALNDLGAQDLQVCLQILDRCPELLVLAILETPVMLGLDMDSDENLQDAERDVFESTLRLVRISLERYTEDWTSGVLTGRDFWQRAEELVARRGIYVSEARTFRVASH